MLTNIPAELRELHQWVIAGQNKLPLNPRTGQAASVTDPDTWGSFDEAVRSGYKHIGFVLSPEDPYTIIDLDDPARQAQHGQEAVERATRVNAKVAQTFESYTELSQSGQGLHIIVKGKVPSGVRRDSVEVYSFSRYMICTGVIVKPLPITDCQDLLDVLYKEIGYTPTTDLVDVEGPLSDEEVLDMAMNASNAEKFNTLCSGDMTGYPSQSEADLALLSILAFYTQDNEQVRRLFRYSALGKREKAVRNDKYLNFALSKIRAKQPPPVDMTELLALANKATEIQQQAPYCDTVPIPAYDQKLKTPPGLVGEIALYIYSSSVRPVEEVALVAALALVAGICGRSYNVSDYGLQQYLILLAKTGVGKEGAASGINRLIAAIRPKVPMVDTFVGPGMFASGPALVRVLDEKPCLLSVLGEFGLTLQQLCDPRANSAEVTLRRILLDLYGKSGWAGILQSSAYADKEKNTKSVRAPNLTILGEATPESFFEGLAIQHIASGLIPRFSIIEYKGQRPPRNRNANQPPCAALTQKLIDLVTISLTTSNNQTCAPVQLDAAATATLDAFDAGCDHHMNESLHEASLQAWNRAHLKALKISALLAVGCNPHQPVITKDLAQWAIDFVVRDISTILERYSSGDIGTGQAKQDFDLRNAIEDYVQRPFDKVSKYQGVTKELHADRIIPYDYLRRRARSITAFNNDRRGAKRALEETLLDMVNAGILIQLPPAEIFNRYKKRAIMYTLGEAWQ